MHVTKFQGDSITDDTFSTLVLSFGLYFEQAAHSSVLRVETKSDSMSMFLHIMQFILKSINPTSGTCDLLVVEQRLHFARPTKNDVTCARCNAHLLIMEIIGSGGLMYDL